MNRITNANGIGSGLGSAHLKSQIEILCRPGARGTLRGILHHESHQHGYQKQKASTGGK
jgi:hypothetical protein